MRHRRQWIVTSILGVALSWTAGALAPAASGQKAVDIRLNTGVPPGTANSLGPRVAASASRVYAVWSEDRTTSGTYDVYFNRSGDSGATWNSSDVRINTTPPGTANVRVPDIAAAGSAVYVVWQDFRNGQSDIYFNRSLDGGITWMSNDQRLESDLPGGAYSTSPRIAAFGTNVFVVWQDSRNGQDDIYFNRSVDSGSTWLPSDTRIDTGDPLGASQSQYPVMAVAGGDLCVAWQDSRNGQDDIYFNRSSNLGLTWLPLATRLDTGSAPGSSDSSLPRIAASGSSVYVVWRDFRSGAWEVYLNGSQDGGVSWNPSDVRVDHQGPATSGSPDVSAWGGCPPRCEFCQGTVWGSR